MKIKFEEEKTSERLKFFFWWPPTATTFASTNIIDHRIVAKIIYLLFI